MDARIETLKIKIALADAQENWGLADCLREQLKNLLKEQTNG